MAEKGAEATCDAATGSEGQGNWWDSWLTSAKTKSAEVYSMVRKDLDEIGSAVKSEASHVINSTSNVIGKTLKLDVPESPANVMKKSFSSFIGQVSTALSPEPDDEDDTEVILSSGDTTMLSTYKKELEALQRVDATFLVPAYSPEFEAWWATLEPVGDSVISPAAAAKRLHNSSLLRAQYQRLVPAAVSHDHFWERYLFRVALLQDRLAAAARKQPPQPTEDPVLAHLPLQTTPHESPKKDSPVPDSTSESPYESPDVETVAWEEEDFANDLELTEEQQILLLEEYEKEIASKKLTKQTSSRDIANNNTEDKTTNTNPSTSPTKTGKAGSTKSNTKQAKSPNKTPAKSSDTTKSNIGKNRDKLNNKPAKKSPKKGKTDVCGNNLVEDYFGDSQVKDDASANSDESWEKEFEIDDVDKLEKA